MIDTDVLIVGAGPTGLTLAGDLARAAVSHMVVERRSDDPNTTRAFALHARTLEQLDLRGVADELVATGRRVPGIRLFRRTELSLAGLPSRFPFVLVTPQYETERVLATRGVQMVSGSAVTAVRQDPKASPPPSATVARCGPVTWSAATACVAWSASRSACRSPAGPCSARSCWPTCG